MTTTTVIRVANTPITIRPAIITMLAPGDRVQYIPPPGSTHHPTRAGTLVAIAGVTALVQFDDLGWPAGAPLERLTYAATQHP